MLDFIWAFNGSIFVLFTAFYIHQIIYTVVALLFRARKQPQASKQHRFAVLIAARNESAVIASLIKSLKSQNYPQELTDIYVIADNCDDDTAQIARDEGAFVYERFNKEQIGKGFALDYALGKMAKEGKRSLYDGFFIFDADNIVDENFISEMNKVFDRGYSVVTGYRNSKNFGDSWITMGYSLWFLREVAYLNKPRMLLNTCCMVSGTGFLVKRDIIDRDDGWKCFLLTEDIQFNAKCILGNEKMGYCENAIFYDEQPTTFKESWKQRLRWMRGTYQVLWGYGTKLLCGIFKGKPLAKFDILMSMTPAILATLVSVTVNLTCFILACFKLFSDIGVIGVTLKSVLMSLGSFYFAFLGMGTLTVISEWKRIKAPWHEKLLAILAFPLFIFTYIPISVAALFKKVQWSHIKHTVVKSSEDFK